MEVISGTSMGLFSVCFWKKDFAVQDIKVAVCFLAGGFLCISQTAAPVVLALIAIVAWQAATFDALLRNWRMFLLTSTFWTAKHFGICMRPCHFAYVALAAASLQLFRRPDSLKVRLRNWRVASGPLYTLAASSNFFCMLGGHGATGALLAGVGLWSVTFAGIALRPDNAEFDKALMGVFPGGAIPWPHDYTSRVKCHGILMVTSVVSLALGLALEGAWLSVSFFASLIFMEIARRLQKQQ